MTEGDHQDPPAPPSASVPELINDYRAQKDAWRAWESQIEKLHHQILAAAERRAASIVTTARSDIRRILVEARRELLALTSQVREVTGGQEDGDGRGETAPAPAPEASRWSGSDAEAVPGTAASDIHGRLLSARHDVGRLLDEARPALESLSEKALTPRQSRQPKLDEERTPAPAPERPPRDPASSGNAAWPLASAQDGSYLHTSRGFGDENQISRSRNVLVALASVVAAAMLFGLVWWLRPEPVSIELPTPQATPQAAAAPAPEVPLQPSPAPAVDRTPPPTETVAPGSLLLIVEARREAWIQSTIDGKADIGRLYPAGETRRIEGARGVVLRVGDAGAVYVSVNGKDAEILGQDGRIVTRRYGVDNEPVPPGPLDGPSSSAEPPQAPVSRGTR